MTDPVESDNHDDQNGRPSEKGGFFEQLKRRNVTRVGIAYLAISWLLLQVADTLVSIGVFEEWIARYTFFAALIGFPIALVVSWSYELTPDGLKSANDAGPTQKAAVFGRRQIDLVIIGALSLVVVLLVLDNYILESMDSTIANDEQISIAVLPFANFSDDPQQENFADGLTEELLNSLAGIKNLRVISRTSSFTFKDQNIALSEIAAQLGVDHILEGSVRKAGNTVRVTAQLIDANSDTHLWSDTFDRQLSVDNLLEIQTDVAVIVAAALHAEIRPQELESLSAAGPANLQALDLYHDGMYFLRLIETGQGEDVTFQSAIEKFSASIQSDPGWAPSHAALGRIHHFLMNSDDREENARLSRQHILTAIEIDNQYGPAFVSLGYINHMAGDFAGAERAYLRASELGFNQPWGYAIYLKSVGRFDESIELYKEAVKLDPLSTPPKYQLAEAYVCAERYSEAIDAFEELATVFPDNPPYFHLAYSYARQGEFARAVGIVEEYERANDSVIGSLGIIYAIAGMPERAESAFTEEAREEFHPVGMARLAITLGHEDLALDLLERAANDDPQDLYFMRCFAEIRSLSANPRFERIQDVVGLPD